MAEDFGLSFILPHRESDPVEKTVELIKKACTTAGIPFEIIAVTGNHPTVQRNRAVESTKYPVLFFVDNDSQVDSKSLLRVKELFNEHKSLAVLGGPALTPDTNSRLQKTFCAVLSSRLAVGRLSARYIGRGTTRVTDDGELILCNMQVSRECFLKHGGFNEKLYPNEENEFIHRLKEQGELVLYDPQVTVQKDQRETAMLYRRQFFTYGRGRGEQTRISPKSFNPAVLIPAGFSIYLMALLPVFVLLPHLRWFASIPLITYSMLAVVAWGSSAVKFRTIFITFPWFFFINHFFYGLGFWRGLTAGDYTALRREPVWNIRREA